MEKRSPPVVQILSKRVERRTNERAGSSDCTAVWKGPIDGSTSYVWPGLPDEGAAYPVFRYLHDPLAGAGFPTVVAFDNELPIETQRADRLIGDFAPQGRHCTEREFLEDLCGIRTVD